MIQRLRALYWLVLPKVMSLFSQMVGRGTRLAPNKKDLIVIDVVDGTVTHSLVTLPTLMGLPNTLDIKGHLLTKRLTS